MIAEREIIGGVRYESPQVTIPTYMTAIWVGLICSDWTEHLGLGIVYLGIEYSIDGGSNWIIAAETSAPMGVYSKETKMPGVGVSCVNKIPGSIWRLYLLATSTIDLGLRGVFRAWLSP
jgi:hypothetical protein